MKLLRTGKVAELLGVSHDTVMRWIRAGRIPGSRLGHQYRISVDDLVVYLRPRNQLLAIKLQLASGPVVVLSKIPDVKDVCQGRLDVVLYEGWFDAAAAFCARPRGIVFDLGLGREECVQAAMRMHMEPERPTLAAILPFDGSEGLKRSGLWDEQLRYPEELRRLAAVIDQCQRR